MTNDDELEREVAALKHLLTVAWRSLAADACTSYDRRELRNEMNARAQELKQHLALREAKLRNDQREAAERVAQRAPATRLRLLG